MKVKYYRAEGKMKFGANITGKRITIHGSRANIPGDDISDENYKKLKEAGYDLKTMRDGKGTPMFIFPAVIDKKATRTQKEASYIRREKTMDNAVAKEKETKALRATRKNEKEELEKSGLKKDEFGPLENTPEWNKLSSRAKGNIRKQRDIHFGYRVIKFKGGIIERTDQEPKEEEELSLEDTKNTNKPKGKTLGDL